MLIVRYELSDGTFGEDMVLAGQRWIFGRPGGDEPPNVAVDDRRVSRASLVVRDSGPGPVVFRGQRGDAEVGLLSADGSTQWLEEGTAGNLTPQERRVEMHLGGEHVITMEIEFADRPSVVERQREIDGLDSTEESVEP